MTDDQLEAGHNIKNEIRAIRGQVKAVNALKMADLGCADPLDPYRETSTVPEEPLKIFKASVTAILNRRLGWLDDEFDKL